MSAPPPLSCELLPWDTEFFCCRIARVCGDTLRPERAAENDEWSRSHRIRCLYFLSRADDPVTIQTAEQNGFGLVDIRVTFECRMAHPQDRARPVPPADASIRLFQPGDLSALQSIARAIHQGTRFFNDPHFPRQRVEELYSTWLTLETQGRAQAVWVAASITHQPLGYVSCHFDPERRMGQIGLIGVSSQARGKGIGRSLVLAAVDWFRTQGAREVTVVTQGNNQAAQRLYQNCGFLSCDLQLWYHKWYPQFD